jgi:hypothetical protein
MSLQELIRQIEAAEGADRSLDIEIAQQVGYKKKVEYVEREGSKETVRTVVWADPLNGEFGKVPQFTASVDRAHDLALLIDPVSLGGVSWEESGSVARINNGPYHRASTPALALCAAALGAKLWSSNN